MTSSSNIARWLTDRVARSELAVLSSAEFAGPWRYVSHRNPANVPSNRAKLGRLSSQRGKRTLDRRDGWADLGEAAADQGAVRAEPCANVARV